MVVGGKRKANMGENFEIGEALLIIIRASISLNLIENSDLRIMKGIRRKIRGLYLDSSEV